MKRCVCMYTRVLLCVRVCACVGMCPCMWVSMQASASPNFPAPRPCILNENVRLTHRRTPAVLSVDAEQQLKC